LSVLTDDSLIEQEQEIPGLPASLAAMIGPGGDPCVEAALKGEALEELSERDRLRAGFILRRILRHCMDRALTEEAATVRTAIDAVKATEPPEGVEGEDPRMREEIARIEEQWEGESRQAQFARPSAALVAMRKTAQRMIAAGKPVERSLLGKQIAELEAEEERAASERLADAYAAEVEAVKKKYEAGAIKRIAGKNRAIRKPVFGMRSSL
jgi:hypothetical protein